MNQILTIGFLAALLVIGPVLADDPYREYLTPSGGSCCGGGPRGDCHPAEMRVGEDGQIELHYAEAWRPLRFDLINQKPSPDGGWHVCWIPRSGVPHELCIIAPMEA